MFYDKLNALCQARGTSPSAVLLSLGMSKSNITRWKAGQTPKIETVRLLAEQLRVGFWELLDRTPQGAEASPEEDESTKQLLRLLPQLSEYQKKIVVAQVEGLLRIKE